MPLTVTGKTMAHIECERCHHKVVVEVAALGGLYGEALFQKLRCRQCGTRRPSVVMVWHQDDGPDRRTNHWLHVPAEGAASRAAGASDSG